MSVTRRTFLLNTSYAGTGLLFVDFLHPLVPEQSADPSLALHAAGIRMAATPATHYRAYRSKPVSLPDTTTWVQIELGKSIANRRSSPLSCTRAHVSRAGPVLGGRGFPVRFRIEASDDEAFTKPVIIADFTGADVSDPKDSIAKYSAAGARGRYVRLTALRQVIARTTP
jgi:uncharacterized protein